MQQATHEKRLSPLVDSLRNVLETYAASGKAIHPAFGAAAEVFADATVLIARVAAYGRITVLALGEYTEDKPTVVNTVLRDPSVQDIWNRAVVLIRQGDAEFLEHEREHISDHVFAQACIAMWSALEAGIEDMLLAVVRADRTLLETDDIKKIQVPLLEFNALTDDERTEFLIERVEEKQRSKFSRGAGRFEDTLKAFGFSGTIDEQVKRNLLEFAAVRNCLVHRRGMVDRRFAKDCPTSTRTIGSRITLTFDECRRYELAATHYLTCVLARIDQRYGAAFDQLNAFQARLLSDLIKANTRTSSPRSG